MKSFKYVQLQIIIFCSAKGRRAKVVVSCGIKPLAPYSDDITTVCYINSSSYYQPIIRFN